MNAGYLRAPWGLLHYRCAGTAPLAEQVTSGRPVLVLLHQSPLSSRRYHRVLDALAEFCVPIAVDTPGYGRSEAGAGDWTVEDYAGVPWLVADALGVAHPWLFGRATGAVFALHAAALRPGRAAGVVLHGVPVYTGEEKADRLANFAPPYQPTPDGAHLSWIWRRISAEYPLADAALVTELVADYLAAGQDFAAAYRAIWRHDLGASVRLAGEVDLLLAGSADRIRRMHDRAVAEIPHRAALELAGATDFVAEQDPVAFSRALASAIDRPT
ncbi:alpha/beta fold hydrolase [Actinophytocola sediminis]